MRNSFLVVDKKGKNLIEIIWNEIDRERERIWKIARLIRGKSIINNNNDIYRERRTIFLDISKMKIEWKIWKERERKVYPYFLVQGVVFGMNLISWRELSKTKRPDASVVFPSQCERGDNRKPDRGLHQKWEMSLRLQRLKILRMSCGWHFFSPSSSSSFFLYQNSFRTRLENFLSREVSRAKFLQIRPRSIFQRIGNF